MLGRLANNVLRRVGFELRRSGGSEIDRASPQAILEAARRNGLRPGAIIDVGAAFGDFARIAAQVFPGTDLLLVEPLEEYGDRLRALVPALPGRASWVAAVATRAAGTARFHVHDDLVGSSLLRETEEPGVDGRERVVPAIRLDDEIVARRLGPPYLLKVDVQGNELAVIEGMGAALTETDFAMLEVSFFDFFEGGSTVVEVVAAMAARDMVPYDATQPLYRPLDGALAQIDICFARKAGLLRRRHAYATPEQRQARSMAMRADAAPVPAKP
jgi:FkbM family methyltransferase